MINYQKSIKVTLVGGGSQNWSSTIIRDIIFKPGMERAKLEFRLLDLSLERARAIEAMFRANLKAWKIDRVSIHATCDPEAALTGADFVIITISTGRLESMRHDLAIPGKYGVYHTVGDTAGPGGWSRASAARRHPQNGDGAPARQPEISAAVFQIVPAPGRMSG